MTEDQSKDKLDYTERMIQISDDVPVRDIGGRQEHKRQWLKNGRLELWQICETIAEFKHRARLSESEAKRLDRHFYSIHGGRMLETIKKSRRSVKKSSRSQLDKLREVFGDP